MQFWYEADITDPDARFVLRRSEPDAQGLLLSHGWLDGTLVAGTLEDAVGSSGKASPRACLAVVPAQDLVFVNRHGRELAPTLAHVPPCRLRAPTGTAPRLSLLLVRWGGKHRLGEGMDPSQEGDGGWGQFGAPPTDWYMAGIVQLGLLRHPQLGAGADGHGPRDCEVASLFLGSSSQVEGLVAAAPGLAGQLRGAARACFWMLWPADWETDWDSPGSYIGYVERRMLFQAMRTCEAAGLQTAFPHPAVLYEEITSKRWMATIAAERESRLPAAVLASSKDIECDVSAAAASALSQLEALRGQSRFSDDGGPSAVNRGGLQKGAVKIGWSWEAKFVWFWRSKKELEQCLTGMALAKGYLGDNCIVQEWVDFDFELRLFFLPPGDWAPPAILRPAHFEYTAWATVEAASSPGSFNKYSRRNCLRCWGNDEAALESAHEQAEEASQFLIARLLAVHDEPVPMVRMDFMLKRLGPGRAQVVFGEYCEMGACCLKWEEGPPRIWQAALDRALERAPGGPRPGR